MNGLMGGTRNDLHDLVSRFSEALMAKLMKAEEKHGWQGAWRRPNWHSELLQELLLHVSKGDPLDVAAYCAFAWHHGWRTGIPHGAADAALRTERDTAIIQRDAVKSSLDLAQTLSEQQQTRSHALEGLLGEVGRLLRGYERDHLAKDPPQPEKAKRNGDMAARIEVLLGRVVTTQGGASNATTDAPFLAWASGDDEPFGPGGEPNIELASTAMQVWSICQQRSRITVQEAAHAFNVSPAMIREAVDGHHWMLIVADGGDELIHHEGE